MHARTHTHAHRGNFIIPLCCEKLDRSHSGSEKWIIFSVSPSWTILSHGDEEKPNGVRVRACREAKDPDRTCAESPGTVRWSASGKVLCSLFCFSGLRSVCWAEKLCWWHRWAEWSAAVVLVVGEGGGGVGVGWVEEVEGEGRGNVPGTGIWSCASKVL